MQSGWVINGDHVAKLLKVPKYKIVRTLKTYIIDNKNVMLTPHCFKRLCLTSRSKGGEEVRTYFIELESLLFFT
jgi:hypothetical protein